MTNKMTTIYLMRHSEPFKNHLGIEDVNDNLLLSNMKTPLSINGEKLSERLCNNEEFNNLNVVWSSNYARAMSTAKYFAYNNNLKVNISDKLGERIHGINTWSELPDNFEIKQLIDENFKVGNGESQVQVRERLLHFVNYLLKEYKNKRILLVSHATAITFLLKNWCIIQIEENKLKYIYNGKVLLNGHLNYCETFKLNFDDNNNLISIEKL